MSVKRRYPIGVEVQSNGEAHARVWAPARQKVVFAIAHNGAQTPLESEGNGYFSATVRGVSDGTLYGYRLDEDEKLYPDPMSRFQPEGPHGPSQIVDPRRFSWSDSGWSGISMSGQVLYEMHIGTFTREGTYAAAEKELAELAACGITCLEVMPIAEFPGRFGWGYDGVNLFAPTRLYGSPDDFRKFVDTAHRLGMGVILDVVYNHLGPDGNYLKQFAPAYFSVKHKTEWGEAINFDDTDCGPVREYFCANAAYWIDEYHLDGLRLDATQNIYDDASPGEHILTDIGRACRQAANGRSVIVVNENEVQHPELCRPIEKGGYGLDGLWNDDFHHTAMVALTGRNEAYYTDYRGAPQEFVSSAKYGYLFQGQWFSWQEKRRGRPAFDVPPMAYINFIQNHDQIANSARGLRAHLLTSPARYRAVTAVMLLGPGTPMFFQGQEFAASAPFFYFADHNPDLAKLVRKGRVEFLAQFRSITDPVMQRLLPDPESVETFEACRLDFSERDRNAPLYQLTKDLLRLRREDPVFQAPKLRGLDGAVLGSHSFVLRFFADDGLDRLLVVNLGTDQHLLSVPEPLLAPPAGGRWVVRLSTEEPKYGGMGVGPVNTPDEGWRIPGESATVLIAEPGEPIRPIPKELAVRRIVY